VALGIFVACQTMLLGVTVNLAEPDDRATKALLHYGMLGATLVVMLLLGLPLAREAMSHLRRRRLSMELFFTVGVAGAFVISVLPLVGQDGPVYFEVVSVLLVIYTVGRLIQTHSRQRALAAATSLSTQVPTARRIKGGAEEVIAVSDIACGDRVRVLPGELIPVDGRIVSGAALVSQAAFTGEWASVHRGPGDAVLAASATEDAALVVEATSRGSDRRVDRLAGIIRDACDTPTRFQRMADRFVAVFMPLVLVIALLAGVFWARQDSLARGLFVALSVILVACPCAAGLATPLTLWQLLGRLSRRGLTLRSAESAERLSQVDLVVLDKTGTLAEEALEVARLEFAPGMEALARRLIASTEAHSAHPVAAALRDIDVPAGAPPVRVHQVRIVPGRGVEADVSLRLAPAAGRGAGSVADASAPSAWAAPRDPSAGGEAVSAHVYETRHRFSLLRGGDHGGDTLSIVASLDGEAIGTATLREKLRDSADDAVAAFQRLGLGVLILTGDASAATRAAARLAKVEAGLTPEQKLARMDELGEKHRVLFVGDGVNDAAAMAHAHASIALAHGAEVTVETASATLHGGNLRLIPEAIAMARSARGLIRGNLLFAFAYNGVGVAVAAAGWLHPVFAAVLMSLSSLLLGVRAFREPVLPASSPRAALSEALTPAPALPRWLAATHLVALVGQCALLIPLARLQGSAAAAAVLVPLAAGLVLLRLAWRRAGWSDHFLGMLTLGGLGMNLGWWYDLDLGSAISPEGTIETCCALAASLKATELGHSSHWMYWGMLLLGVPGMLLQRTRPYLPSLRQWVRVGTLLSIIGMCFGMWAGAQLALRLESLTITQQVIASYGLMIAGMLAGMVLPIALEAALSRDDVKA
jgi:heavy metal translocating P-type ATPase